MPPKRPSKRTTTTSSTAQSTLAFHGAQGARITKSGAAQTATKSKYFKASAPAKRSISPTPADEPASAQIDVATPAKAEEVPKQKTNEEENVNVEYEEEHEAFVAPAVKAETETAHRDENETEALKISDARIRKYWAAKERERIAKRVHQGGLSTEEKVLREFDIAAKFGPCVGIARIKRWKRAKKLGLEPPVEVLAVLLKEEGTRERAYVDELMGTRFVQ
ncbi:hypothetical protein EJ05DRAFT_157057 [Pseudovirgaria hyperparasitica]|uniref:DNA polymerase delta subunit 4 n=1 Tax=Pseudovirgaria hyperparasitica TaxID=470096 RepID=A0A6A6VVM9_9PEZI|nr:uncharacterized protein EJ05DRAFT_157057 [Pseudovirgaria hyperparasitica]KAF2753846.1 hypothetical protein EJ05DRAFT_157057 [Pseudovirgaria hyperparasitica]